MTDVVDLKGETHGAELFHMLCAEFHREHVMAGGPSLTLDTQKVAAEIHRLTEHGRIGVALKDGEVVGSVGLVPDAPWWTRERMIYDVWFYVRRAFRVSRAAEGLMRYALGYQRDLRLPLAMAIYNQVDFDRVETFYRHHGFEKQGTYFIRRV